MSCTAFPLLVAGSSVGREQAPKKRSAVTSGTIERGFTWTRVIQGVETAVQRIAQSCRVSIVLTVADSRQRHDQCRRRRVIAVLAGDRDIRATRTTCQQPNSDSAPVCYRLRGTRYSERPPAFLRGNVWPRLVDHVGDPNAFEMLQNDLGSLAELQVHFFSVQRIQTPETHRSIIRPVELMEFRGKRHRWKQHNAAELGVGRVRFGGIAIGDTVGRSEPRSVFMWQSGK